MDNFAIRVINIRHWARFLLYCQIRPVPRHSKRRFGFGSLNIKFERWLIQTACRNEVINQRQAIIDVDYRR